MKLVFRVFAILAAAMVVVGITYALNQGGFIGGDAPTRPERAEFTASPSTNGEVGEFRGHGGEGEGGAGIGALAEVAKSLVIVGVIVALFTFIQFVGARVRGKVARHQSSPSPNMPI